MEERVARLESRVAYLSDCVASLEERLQAAERGLPPPPQRPAGSATLSDLVGIPPTPLQQWLSLAGRTLVILGGAYLIRALTGTDLLPTRVVVAIGLIYGAPWLLLASRAAARGAQLDASAHALTTALIGYPLVWEATLRFGALPAAESAFLLAALTSAAFLIAAIRRLRALAAVVTFGTAASAIGLAIGTGEWIPYTVLATAVGIATLWLGYLREWTFLRWPAAMVANVMLLVVTGRAAVSGSTRGALLLQLVMLVAYLGSFAVRTLVIGRIVIPFEVAQSVAALAVAFGGAIALIRTAGANVFPVGLGSLILAGAGYLVAFSFVERRRDARNFFFYALLALLFAIVGIALCLPSPAASLVYGASAVLAVMLARHYHRLTIALHASAYGLAAMVASGLLTTSTVWILAPAASAIVTPTPLALGALLALGLTVMPVRAPTERWGVAESAPRVLMIAIFAWVATGELLGLAIAAIGGGAPMDGAVLATVRTSAFVATTLALAAVARRADCREAGWLVYPLIVTIGVKLLFVDFPRGRPETLFVGLAAYGCALIVAPRLLRRTEIGEAQPSVQ